MSTNHETCPHCTSKVKDTLMFGNLILESVKTEIINLYELKHSPAHCQKCGTGLFEKALAKLKDEKDVLLKGIERVIGNVPVITTHSPMNWNYEVLGIVTGQSVSGTGVVAEFASSFSDLFGVQSNTLSGKLRGGENYCFNQIRKKALDLGGNAVIATDIDYSEVGSIKGMIMVCMAGTAVNLNNIEVLGEKRVDVIQKLVEANARAEYLKGLAGSYLQ